MHDKVTDQQDALVEAVRKRIGSPLPLKSHDETDEIYREIVATVTPLIRKQIAECASCDICGAFPCRGGCWIGEFLGEERHRCEDEDACQAAFNSGAAR